MMGSLPPLLAHLSLLSAPEEKKAAGGGGGGGGPVRLRSTSRKDSISEDEMVLRERSYDYQFRYCGHCNTTTDIKEANFFGRSETLSKRRVQGFEGWGHMGDIIWRYSLPGSASVPLGSSGSLHLSVQ